MNTLTCFRVIWKNNNMNQSSHLRGSSMRKTNGTANTVICTNLRKFLFHRSTTSLTFRLALSMLLRDGGPSVHCGCKLSEGTTNMLFSLLFLSIYIKKLCRKSRSWKSKTCNLPLLFKWISSVTLRLWGASRVCASITDSDLSVVLWNKKFLDAVSLNKNTNSHETYPHEKKNKTKKMPHDTTTLPFPST